eukprot:TRINITY_DN1776_c0_g1_i1.p1 TRINITY_DN1776_c0_g1~~TRINITY_DN1776_c0_g1_i1.p1  ORF type:complete len:405 (-),score=74.23 TRINITY_DN1776_c0_g1_i1:2-1216(-)
MPAGPASLKTVRTEVNFGNQGTEYFDVYPRYKILSALGQGGFGFVVEAEDLEATDFDEEEEEPRRRLVAIKKLPAIFRNETLKKSALREITMLKHFRHDNILRIRDMVIPFPEENGEVIVEEGKLLLYDVYVVCDKMDMDLADAVNSATVIELEQRKFFAYQILRGLKAIHSAKVLHRDLKPQNILVNKTCDLKICDFGSAREHSPLMTKLVTTQWYRAPEVLLEMEVSDKDMCGYSSSVDIWSTGCIIAEMMLGHPIFRGRASNYTQVEAIIDLLGTPSNLTGSLAETWKEFAEVNNVSPRPGKPWSEIFPADQFDADERDLIVKMLRFSDRERITVQEALEHPYLQDWHDPSDEPVAESEFVYPYEDIDAQTALLMEFADFHPEIKTLLPSLERVQRREVKQ